MGQILSASGEQASLERIVNKRGDGENLTLRLYQNDRTPSRDDAASAYQEASYAGYSAKELDGPRWTVAENEQTRMREAMHPAQLFMAQENEREQFIYGYYYTYPGGSLYSAERFTGGPFRVQHSGDKITVTPVMTARSSV